MEGRDKPDHDKRIVSPVTAGTPQTQYSGGVTIKGTRRRLWARRGPNSEETA
jgi:hypothetical protein